MKQTVKVVGMILTFIMLISMIGSVFAASALMTLNSASKLKEGETVEVTLRISNVDAGEGIDAIVATLDYDTNVFEEVKQENLVGANGWNVNLYSPESKTFTMTRSNKTNTASGILTITLKAKKNISASSTNIKVKDITASGGAVDVGGTGDIIIPDVFVSVAKPVVTPPPTNTVTGSDTATDRLPQTGENIALIVGGLALIAVIATVMYIKYNKLK